MNEELKEEYMNIPVELRAVLFDLERSFGLKVGGGQVFSDIRSLRELVDVRYAFIFISNTYYGFSQRIISEWIGVKMGLVHHAKKTVRGLMNTNTMYRNRMFNVAVNNGIMDLVYEITKTTDDKRKRQIFRDLEQ